MNGGLQENHEPLNIQPVSTGKKIVNLKLVNFF